MREKEEHITRVTVEDSRKLEGKTDSVRLDALDDEDIARAVATDPEAAPLDTDWTRARLVLPPWKELVTLRLDRDVLDWFRKAGKGYQTRINAVLRAYKDARLQGCAQPRPVKDQRRHPRDEGQRSQSG